MFTYLVKVCKEHEDLKTQQQEIREFTQEIFRKNKETIDSAVLRKLLQEKLLEMLQHPENFIVSVDSMWRSDTPQKVSFFINLLMKTKMMDRKKSVILFAEYKEITSLKESAAFQVSKFVRNLPELFLPVTLQTEISKFL